MSLMTEMHTHPPYKLHILNWAQVWTLSDCLHAGTRRMAVPMIESITTISKSNIDL